MDPRSDDNLRAIRKHVSNFGRCARSNRVRAHGIDRLEMRWQVNISKQCIPVVEGKMMGWQVMRAGFANKPSTDDDLYGLT